MFVQNFYLIQISMETINMSIFSLIILFSVIIKKQIFLTQIQNTESRKWTTSKTQAETCKIDKNDKKTQELQQS